MLLWLVILERFITIYDVEKLVGKADEQACIATSIRIENASEFLSISAAIITPETISRYLSAHNKGRNPLVQGKEEKLKF